MLGFGYASPPTYVALEQLGQLRTSLSLFSPCDCVTICDSFGRSRPGK